MKTCLRFLLLLPCLAFAGCYGLTIARVSVVDAETKRPIRHAPVSFTCDNWNLDVSGKNSPGPSHHEGNTGRDNAAWFAAWDNTALCRAHMGHFEGHYQASVSRQGIPIPLLHLPFFRLLRLEAVPVRHPVPLLLHHFPKTKSYKDLRAKNPSPLFPPGTSPDVAIDLLEGDWLPPLGNGKTADILVTVLSPEETGRYYHTLRFTFPGDGNGIRPVEPNLDGGPYVWTAPDSGYASEFGPISWEGRNYDKPIPCYCFRIRSEYDADGRLVSCHYGKIYDCIRAAGVYKRPSRILLPTFSCYVNPAPLDPNLEPLPPYGFNGP